MDMFKKVLEDLKALPESIRVKLRQRHEPWVDHFREQVSVAVHSKGPPSPFIFSRPSEHPPRWNSLGKVDVAPGEGQPKRVVNVQELAEILTLGNEVGGQYYPSQ